MLLVLPIFAIRCKNSPGTLVYYDELTLSGVTVCYGAFEDFFHLTVFFIKY